MFEDGVPDLITPPSLDDLMLQIAGEQDLYEAYWHAYDFLRGSPELSCDDFIKIVAQLELAVIKKKAEVGDEFFINRKHEFINDFLEIKQSLTTQDFIRILPECSTDLEIRNEFIIKFFKIKKDVQVINEVAQGLYANLPSLQIELFLKVIYKDLINKDNFHLLDFSKVDDDELAYFLQSSEVDGLDLDAKIIIKVAQGRVKSVYSFLQGAVGTKSLQQCLTGSGISEVSDLFLQQIGEVSLLDVFFYYEIRNQLNHFYSLLTPEFQQEIADAFQPSITDSLVTGPEMDKLQQLVRVGVPLPTKFIPAATICDIFQEKVPAPPLSQAEIISFASNFNDLEIFNETQKRLIDDQMKGLLSIPEIDLERDRQQIIDFFTIILGEVTVAELNDGNRKKIVEFFKKSRNYIAHLFKQEGGIKSFLSCLNTIADGCSANIGTHVSIALYAAMLSKVEDGLLLQYFVDYVTEPLFKNRMVGDGIGSDNNPFENHKVRGCYLSAPGMLSQTTQLFYDSNLSNPIKRNPLDFICESFELKKLVAEGTIMETDLDLFQPALHDFKTELFGLTEEYEKAAQVAAYLAIENVVGDEFTERFLDQSIILLARQTKELIADTKPIIADYIARLPELRQAREQRIVEENRNAPPTSTAHTGAMPVNSKCCVIL